MRSAASKDHIHPVTSVPPQITLSDFIGQVKGSNSHFANHELSLLYHFSWQTEYGIVSFGGRQLDRVVQYVQNQPAHHLKGTVIPLLGRAEAE